MVIERIEKKDSINVIVHLDNNLKLYLAYEVLLRNGLRKGSEISESHFDILVRENQKFFIKQKAFTLLGKRLHSVYELRTKLRQKKYDLDLINQTIDDLIKGDYLNDTRFAELYSDEKLRLKLWGKTKLKSELIKKGISSQIITAFLEEKFPGSSEEMDNALSLVTKKYNSLKNRNMEHQKLVQRLYAFLISKGYSYDIAKQTVGKLFNLTLEEEQ
ncbi:MAG: regulatory protein RecX [Ignavibacteriaceae bacterium]|nr:regulatory protein RecX [Ignavibacteriaceae bacterium]